MAVSKKQQNKLVSKSKSQSQRAVATSALQRQGKATPAQRTSDMTKANKALRRASVKSDGTPSTMRTNGSSKGATAMRRVNQSIVARGGKPMPTYYSKKK
jgi:hypothetical protein